MYRSQALSHLGRLFQSHRDLNNLCIERINILHNQLSVDVNFHLSRYVIDLIICRLEFWTYGSDTNVFDDVFHVLDVFSRTPERLNFPEFQVLSRVVTAMVKTFGSNELDQHTSVYLLKLRNLIQVLGLNQEQQSDLFLLQCSAILDGLALVKNLSDSEWFALIDLVGAIIVTHANVSSEIRGNLMVSAFGALVAFLSAIGRHSYDQCFPLCRISSLVSSLLKLVPYVVSCRENAINHPDLFSWDIFESLLVHTKSALVFIAAMIGADAEAEQVSHVMLTVMHDVDFDLSDKVTLNHIDVLYVIALNLPNLRRDSIDTLLDAALGCFVTLPVNSEVILTIVTRIAQLLAGSGVMGVSYDDSKGILASLTDRIDFSSGDNLISSTRILMLILCEFIQLSTDEKLNLVAFIYLRRALLLSKDVVCPSVQGILARTIVCSPTKDIFEDFLAILIDQDNSSGLFGQIAQYCHHSPRYFSNFYDWALNYSSNLAGAIISMPGNEQSTVIQLNSLLEAIKVLSKTDRDMPNINLSLWRHLWILLLYSRKDSLEQYISTLALFTPVLVAPNERDIDVDLSLENFTISPLISQRIRSRLILLLKTNENIMKLMSLSRVLFLESVCFVEEIQIRELFSYRVLDYCTSRLTKDDYDSVINQSLVDRCSQVFYASLSGSKYVDLLLSEGFAVSLSALMDYCYDPSPLRHVHSGELLVKISESIPSLLFSDALIDRVFKLLAEERQLFDTDDAALYSGARDRLLRFMGNLIRQASSISADAAGYCIVEYIMKLPTNDEALEYSLLKLISGTNWSKIVRWYSASSHLKDHSSQKFSYLHLSTAIEEKIKSWSVENVKALVDELQYVCLRDRSVINFIISQLVHFLQLSIRSSVLVILKCVHSRASRCFRNHPLYQKMTFSPSLRVHSRKCDDETILVTIIEFILLCQKLDVSISCSNGVFYAFVVSTLVTLLKQWQSLDQDSTLAVFALIKLASCVLTRIQSHLSPNSSVHLKLVEDCISLLFKWLENRYDRQRDSFCKCSPLDENHAQVWSLFHSKLVSIVGTEKVAAELLCFLVSEEFHTSRLWWQENSHQNTPCNVHVSKIDQLSLLHFNTLWLYSPLLVGLLYSRVPGVSLPLRKRILDTGMHIATEIPEFFDLLHSIKDGIDAHLLYWSSVPTIRAVSLLSEAGNNISLCNYSFRVLSSFPIESVFFYVPQIVQLLRHDSTGFIEDYIVQTALHSQLFAHQIIWNIKANAFTNYELLTPDPIKDIMDRVVDRIVDGFTDADRDFYEREFGFFEKVTSISGALKPYIKKSKLEKKKKIDEEMRRITVDMGVYLPSNPESVVIDIDYNSGRPLQSHAKAPFLATFKILDKNQNVNNAPVESRWLSAIFKVGDDCRQDVLALQLIAIFKSVFTAHNLDLYVYPYRVIATAPGCGVIEVIPNSISRDQMGREKMNSLYDYFVFKYGHESTASFQLARANFTRSLAAYSIVSYVLAIKDRHNGNIMLDAEGHIVHIDFGFILDIAPGGITFEQSPFKLTSEMIRVLGPSFPAFEKLCIKAFLALRRHVDCIVPMVRLLSESGLPCFKGENTIRKLRDRFLPNATETEAVENVKGLIRSAFENRFTVLYDAFQKKTNGIPY